MPIGSRFQMRPNVIENCQAIRLVPSGGGPLHYMPLNTVGNHRPLNILPNNNAFYLKPPDCRAYSVPPLSFASQNAGILGFEPSCTMQTSLTAQSRANGARLVNGALCAGSAQASSTSSFPVDMLSHSRLPSPMPVSLIRPHQPSVKCSSAASSASFSINSGAVLSKYSSSHPSSIPSGLQSSGLLTPACLPRAIRVAGVRAMRTHRNAVSISSVESTIDATVRSCNKLNAQSESRLQALQVPYRPLLTVHSNAKSGCTTSDVPEASQNLVMPPVTRTLLNKPQVLSIMAIVSKSPTVVSDAGGGGGITTPSASGVKSVSSFLVSSASAWETPTFPQWSRPAIRKCGDILTACGASTVSSTPNKTQIASYTWYPPTICLQTSSAMADKASNSVMAQNYHSTGSTVPLVIPTNVFPIFAPTVSWCQNGTNSHSSFSVAQQPTQSLSTSQITKSTFSFYNSHLKRPPDCKLLEKPIPFSENSPNNTSVSSAESVISVCSSENISNGQTGIDSSLIPIPVELYDFSNVVRKRKRKSSNKIKDIFRSLSWDSSTSSTSDNINLLSDPESAISSSDSWSSDDSLTMGRQKTRRRCRKQAKRIAYEYDSYSTHPLHNSEVNRKISERRCFVSLENLYLNGKTSVDIRDASENLVCCKSSLQRHMSTVNSLGANVARKKSYKLWTAVNYISDTDEL